MFDSLQQILTGTRKKNPEEGLALAKAQRTLVHHDVTAFAGEFDLDTMQTILTAPVWMTRAERLLLYTLTFCLRPTRYLEIGTFQGGSALIVAAALNALQSDGRIFCVDPAPQIAAEDWAKLADRAQLFEGFSPAILPEVQTAAGAPFDLVLVDGDHSYDGALRDATGVLPYIRHGGYLLFHDSFNSDVGRAIDDFIVQHAAAVLDLGLLTREVTTQLDPEGQTVEWGGIRLIYVW